MVVIFRDRWFARSCPSCVYMGGIDRASARQVIQANKKREARERREKGKEEGVLVSKGGENVWVLRKEVMGT